MHPSHRKGVKPNASGGRKVITAWSLYNGEGISLSCCGLIEFRLHLSWVLNTEGDTGTGKRTVCHVECIYFMCHWF